MKKGKSAKQETTIYGTVNSIEDDKKKKTISIMISTDEKDYIVESNRMGNELTDYLGEEVEVTGILTKGKDGEDRISITKYEILDYDDEDEDYDDNEYYDDEDDEYFDDDDEYYDDEDDEYFDEDDEYFDDDNEYFDDDDEYYDDDDDDYEEYDDDKPYREK
jgi:hypothetical protein